MLKNFKKLKISEIRNYEKFETSRNLKISKF